MQNTRERLWEGKLKKKKKKAGNQVAPPVSLENKSFFNCASSELYQNLTLELYKSLDFAEKIYRTGTSEQNTSYREVLLGIFFFFKKKINSFKFVSTFHPKTWHFQMFASLKWFKGTLKAQKLWSNWAALSSKLSHDNEIHSGLIFWLLPQHATLLFLMRDPIVTIHAKQKPLSLTITPHGYGKKYRLPKTTE